MVKRKLKKYVVSMLYVLAVLMFGTSIYFVQKIVNKSRFSSIEELEYVDSEIVIDNEYIPVINQIPTILRPYLISDVMINKTFYNQDDDATNQEKSIVVYENTYMQNTGTDYTYKETFDIISILDGTVIDVSDNEILGKTIKIRHDNDLVSIYQSLGEIMVKKDDTVLRGQVIGKSGTCNLYSKDSNLHFEISYQGKSIDPETSYNKTQDEL